MPEYRDAVRIVIGVDPALTSKASSDETGIVVCARGVDHCGYVLDDLSCRASPEGWARRIVEAYHGFRADRVVAETNNGGELVETVLRTIDPTLSYKAVHASRGKRVRAEPLVSLYEQGKIFHVRAFPELEAQMCTFDPLAYDHSPDRLDALVWALTELMLHDAHVPAIDLTRAEGLTKPSRFAQDPARRSRFRDVPTPASSDTDWVRARWGVGPTDDEGW
jgi:predicted phage terminase large subunit-like protein